MLLWIVVIIIILAIIRIILDLDKLREKVDKLEGNNSYFYQDD